MSTHYLDTLFSQIPETLRPASFTYFNQRASDLNALFSNPDARNHITLHLDHCATRSVFSTLNDAENARKKELFSLEKEGYTLKQEIRYSSWKWTSIYGHGTSDVSPSDYHAQIQAAQHGKPVTYASLFSTYYSLDHIPDIALSKHTNLSQIDDLFVFLSDPFIPMDIKAIVLHNANGCVNHIALTVPNILNAQEFLAPYSVQYILNDLQIGETLNQQSTWDLGNDYIELVERHVLQGVVKRHEFKVKNTEPLFRSTALGVLRTYCSIAEKRGLSMDRDHLLDTFPDGSESIDFLINHRLLPLD